MEAQIKVGMDASGVEVSAEKVKKSLSSIQNQIQRTTATLSGGEKGSRQFYEALANQRGVSVASLKPYLDQLDAAKMKAEAAAKATDGMKSAVESLGPKLAAVFSGAAIVGFASKLVSVQREFDVLNSSLITVTGSSANAAREMQWIKDFAKETPFGLAQATQGFVKMKALGLDPTRASLTSFGNTASAMGKDLNQMIEAVADASTGEFERLKEFGIKARKAGDEVSLTFQGITTTIGNSAAEITGYLEKLGNVEFAGAMAERAKTLDGAISELADTWDELFRTINTNNAGGLIYDSVKLATSAITDAITIIDAMSGAASENAKQTGAMAAIQGGIATVFETVAVVGANLKFVLVGIGNEIGGLSAQVGQAAQFNFAGVRAIREQMVSDAIAARKEIDATTARILGARDAAKELATYTTRNAGASTDPRRLDAPVTKPTPRTTGGGAGKAIKAEIDEAAKAVALYNDILAKAAGYNANFTESVTALAKAYQLTSMTAEEYRGALDEILGQQPGAQAAAKALKDASAAADKYIDSLNKSADAVEGQLQKLQDEEEALRLSASANITLAEAIAEVEIARLREKQVMEIIGGNDVAAQAIQREIDARRELAQSINSKDAREAAKKGAEKAAEEWQKTADKIEDSITDALMRGFESGKGFADVLRDTVVNMFKTMVLRPVISAAVQPLAQSLAGSAGGTSGGGMGSFTSLFSSVDTGITNSLSGGVQALYNAGYDQLGDAAASLSNSVIKASNSVGGFSNALSYASALNTAFTRDAQGGKDYGKAAGQALGTYLGGPIGSFIGGEIGSALGLKDYSGTYHSGGTGAYSADGGMKYGATAYSFGMGASEYTQGANEQSAALAMAVSGIIDTASTIAGSNQKSFVGTGYADDISPDGAWAGLMIKLGDQLLTDWGRGGDKWPGREFADGAAGQKQYLDAIALDVRKAIDTIGLPEWATKYIDALGEGAGLEGLAQALEKIKLTEAAFVTLGDVFVGLADLSDGAKNALLTVSGGMEALATTASSYYANFYTGEEKAARLTEKTSEAFAKLGLVMPAINDATRANYRALIDELAAKDLSIEANAKAYAGALSLQGAMNELAPTFDAVAQAAKATADAAIAAAKASADAAIAAAEAAAEAAKVRLDTTTAAASEAYSAVQRAVDAQREIYQVQAEAARNAVSEIQGIFNTLESSIATLYGRVDSAQSAATGRAFIENAASNASLTGYLPDSKDLANAISAAMGDGTAYASQAEADFARLSLAGSMSKLKALAGTQLTTAERQLEAAEGQLDSLDEILRSSEQLLDATNGVNTSVLSVADALRLLSSSIAQLSTERIAQQLPTSNNWQNMSSAAGSYQANSNDGGSRDYVLWLYDSLAGKGSGQIDQQGYSYWVEEVNKFGAEYVAQAFEESVKAVRGYAIGTNYVPSDGLAYLHEGEAVVPKAYNPVANGQAGTQSNGRLEVLVEALTNEVRRLQSIVNDGNNHARRTADATNGNPEAPTLVQVVA